VSQEAPPPVVTISDPNNPGALGDVIDGGRDTAPWRPSRTATRRALLVLLVLAVVAVPVAVVRVRAHSAELDAQAVRAIALAPVDGDTFSGRSGSGTVALPLFNSGPAAVRVLSAHIDREGYPTQRLDVVVEKGSEARLDIALPAPCPSQVSRLSQPRVIVLQVRTSRGSVVTKRVSVGDGFGYAYQDSLRATCGFLSAPEAISGQALDVRELPRELRLTVVLTNRGRQAWDIQDLEALTGLTAIARVPIHLDAGATPTSVTTKPVELLLRVVSCEDAKEAASVDPTSDFLEPLLTLYLDEDQVEVFLDPEAATAVEKLVARSCP
jgi:hypothetical protein